MACERTLAILKPNVVAAGHVGAILRAAEAAGLALRGLRLVRLDVSRIRAFYAEHLEKPFYPELEAFMLEGPVVLAVLEGEDAIARWRALLGTTDPAKAAPESLRRLYGEDLTRNGVHGSDGPASATRELGLMAELL